MEAFLVPSDSTQLSCVYFYCQVMIIGERGNGFRGDVAVDNFQLKQGKCDEEEEIKGLILHVSSNFTSVIIIFHECHVSK